MLSGIRSAGVARLLSSSLRIKIVSWFFVPTAIILVAVALVNYYSYQDVTEELVIARDQDLTRLSAGQLSTELTAYPDLLGELTRTPGISQDNSAARQDALEEAGGPLVVFDGGVLVLDTFGKVVAAVPERPELLGQDWSDRGHFRQMLRTPGPVFSNILADGPQGAEVIVVAVPITGDGGEFLGSALGMFRLRATGVSAFYGEILKLRIAEGGRGYLVDGNGRVLYHPDNVRIGMDFSTQPSVQQVLSGRVGAIRTRNLDGEDIVAGFAPVPRTPWGLVTEDSWAALTSGSRGYQRFLLLLLALGVAVPVLFVAVGLRRIMRPVDDLIRAAGQVARGNFSQIITARSGDEIEKLATEFNLMAAQLHESYTHLEQRVAGRTEELRQSEDRYRALFEESRDAIFVSSPGGRVVAVNQAALDLFRFTLEEAIGSDIGDRFVDPADRDRFRQVIGATRSVRDFEVKLRKRSGVEIDCLMTATRRVDEDGRSLGVQGVIRDITERKEAEATLLDQTRDLAVLEERNRMAREIHDTLAQGFTGIVLQLEAGEQALEESPSEVGDHLGRAKSLARDSLQEARRSVWNLLPRALEQRPLRQALQEEVRRRFDSVAEMTHFTVSGDERELSSDVQTALLRICQESLTNIKKHARAREVNVELAFQRDTVYLGVWDNGVGFDVEATKNEGRQRGFGLIGMEQRAGLLRGSLTVTSEIDQGTRVEVRIPTQ